MRQERWFDPYLRRGASTPLAAQEKHLEEARRIGLKITEKIRRGEFIDLLFLDTLCEAAVRHARLARPDLFVEDP